MTRERPSLLLRLSVVVGGATLAIGLVGVVFLLLRGDVEEASAGPGLGALVNVVGAPDGAQLGVVLSWSQGGMDVRMEGRPTDGPGRRFLLPPAPEGLSVRMEVLDLSADPPRPLAVRRGECRAGEEIEVDLAGAPPR